VITIWATFSLLEEFNCFLFVELGSDFRLQRQVSDVEVAVLSILEPLRPFSSLDVLFRPIPGILTFDNVEFSIESESHGRVSCVGSRAVHNHRIKTVQSINSNEVSRLYKVRIDFNFLD